MPGGVGKVSERVISACSRQDRAIASVRNASEIFFHLDSRHAYYEEAERCLYFVNSPQGLVKRTLLASLAGVRHPPVIEQLHLDRHRFFNGACRAVLSDGQAETVLVALRLAGIAVTIRQAT